MIAQSRADSHRLGVAVQIGTVRYKGLFLEDPLAVPWPVVDYLAEQLGIGDASQVKKYAERPKTTYEHAWMIRDAYGYHTFDDTNSWSERQLTRRFRTFLHGWRLMFERQAYESGGTWKFFGGLALGTVGGGKGLIAQHTAAAVASGVEIRYGANVTALHRSHADAVTAR